MPNATLKSFRALTPHPSAIADEIGRKSVDAVITGRITSTEQLTRTTAFAVARISQRSKALGDSVREHLGNCQGIRVARFLLP